MLDSAGGAGAATVVVVAMDGEMGSLNAWWRVLEGLAVVVVVVSHSREWFP